ncbi:MAG: P-loop NTPase fold protein [Nitrososphaera sp.]
MDQPNDAGLLDFDKYSRKIAEIIVNSYPRFTVGIFGGWGTGKTSLMRMVEKQLREKEIPTVWFDAWRYEREDHLAVVPFLRTFRLALEEFTKSKSIEGTGNAQKWQDLKKSLELALKAFLKSSQLSVGIKDMISFDVNFKEIVESLETREPGSGVNILYFDAIKYLESALKKFNGRIVIFVDDLDRCSPEKGLEVLESIKNLFDIEGLIFVIGMDYNTINTLVQRKFPDNPNVTGFDYVKKIVQLPFHIPDWVEKDIDSYVDSVISSELAGSTLEKEFLEKDKDGNNKNKELLIRAVESNPREIKRFINNIILAKAVFDKPVRNLIVVQALKFRRDWSKFLDFIAPTDVRREFLNDYKKLIKDNAALDKYKVFLDKNYPTFYAPEDPLRRFIDAGAGEILLNITDMEEYRRSLEAVSIDRNKPRERAAEVAANEEPSAHSEARKEKNANTVTLKVLETYARDSGRGVARIDYDAMDSIHASTGDIIEISGKRRTLAKCLPLYPADEGKGIIRIDSLTRENANIAIGDIVNLRKVKLIPAEKVTIKPLQAIPSIDERYISDSLESIPLIEGDIVAVTYFGGRLNFQVVNILPEGACFVTERTRFIISSI